MFACAVLQSWRAKMWRIFSQLSLVPAPTTHLHHHRCLTPRVQGPFPAHLALECLITPQVHLYIVCFIVLFALLLWTFSKLVLFNCGQEMPCFHGCRWSMVWWEPLSSASLWTREQGPACPTASLPSAGCLSLTIQGSRLRCQQCFLSVFVGMNSDDLSFIVFVGIKSSIKCLKKQLGRGPPLPMSLALHHLDPCLKERLKPCPMPRGVHLNGRRKRLLESLPPLRLFYTPMSISPT